MSNKRIKNENFLVFLYENGDSLNRIILCLFLSGFIIWVIGLITNFLK